MTTEFKGTVHIPTFGTTQDIKSLVSGRVGDAEHVPNTNTSISIEHFNTVVTSY